MPTHPPPRLARRRAGLLTSLACTAMLALVGVDAADAKKPAVDAYVHSTPENVNYGGLPIGTPAVASVKSGATVTMETLSPIGLTNPAVDPATYFGQFGVKPGEVLKEAVDFWKSLPTRTKYAGPHIMTGPVYVEGAEPGDTLEVQILDIKPRVPYGVNFTSPESGVFSRGYPGWRPGDVGLDIPAAPADAVAGIYPDVRQHLYRTGKYKGEPVAFFSKDVRVPLKPFFGTIAVAPRSGVFVPSAPGGLPPADGVQSTGPPGEYGGNLDSKDLKAGSRLYLPVFQTGAQFYVGDSHGAQGDGEVSGTALEQSMTGTFRFIVHKRTSRLPTAQDADYYYLYGIDHDLDRAAKGAVYEVVRFLQSHKGWTAAKAYSFASLAVDFVNSELVDGTLVVEGKIPKRLL